MNFSLWQYFHLFHKQTDRKSKLCIPFATGMQCAPVFPVSVSYAKGSLIKHKPWSKHNMLEFRSGDDAINQFRLFLQSNNCPQLLKFEMKQLETNHNLARMDPTHSNVEALNSDSISIDNDDSEVNVIHLVSAMNSFS